MLIYKYVVFALILTYIKHLHLYTQAYFAGLDSVYSLFWYFMCSAVNLSPARICTNHPHPAPIGHR